MNHGRIEMGLLVAAWTLALCSCQSAQKGLVEPSEPVSTSGAVQAEPAQMSQEEMMEKMAELATPGEGHQRLQALIGEWTTTNDMWMDPAAPPLSSEGRASNRWILGGRFLMSEYEGTMMGAPFSGLGITGFNNGTGQYEGIWIDSAGTLIMPVSTGKADASGRVITLRRVADFFGTGTPTSLREVWTIVDENSHTLEMYMPGPDGVEFLNMKIVYRRVRK